MGKDAGESGGARKSASAQTSPRMEERKPAGSTLPSLGPVEINKVWYDSFCESDRGGKTSSSKSNFQMGEDLAVWSVTKIVDLKNRNETAEVSLLPPSKGAVPSVDWLSCGQLGRRRARRTSQNRDYRGEQTLWGPELRCEFCLLFFQESPSHISPSPPTFFFFFFALQAIMVLAHFPVCLAFRTSASLVLWSSNLAIRWHLLERLRPTQVWSYSQGLGI